MQESTQSAFNPVKLVESLKLRATEQQDAQEYVVVRLTVISPFLIWRKVFEVVWETGIPMPQGLLAAALQA